MYAILYKCIESLPTGFKPAGRTDRMYSVCEMRCYHARDDSSMIENK
jgi:hypothetical protein